MNHKLTLFKEQVWGYYASHGRDLPWRHPEPNGSFDPYKIMVSEIMLQQTQVSRVVPKYKEFLGAFPNATRLADASFADVLIIWNGLGYNRRAKFLRDAAQQIENSGAFPVSVEGMTKLPGIGRNTAAAICAYVYNQPVVFIETNIRTVFIHHFFSDKANIDDKELLPFIEKTVDTENPREWYWALMDYGTHLKSVHGNAAKQSKHYVRQSRFVGSKRQLRAEILRSLLDKPQAIEQLAQKHTDERLETVIRDLIKESLVVQKKSGLYIG